MRRSSIRSALVGAVLLAALAGAQGAGAQEKSPTARGTGGAAATVDLLATQAATGVLQDGGNAVDAAVAAAAVLGVTEPFSCGIGGGGFMVIRTAKGKVTTLDGREKSPATMRPDTFWENGAAAQVQRRPLQRALRGRARHAADLGRGHSTSTARSRSRRRWRPASPWRAAASTSTRRSSTPSTRSSSTSTTSRRPPRSTWIPTGPPRTSGRRSSTRTWPRPTGSWPAGRAQRLLLRRRGRRRRPRRRPTRRSPRPPTTPGARA